MNKSHPIKNFPTGRPLLLLFYTLLVTSCASKRTIQDPFTTNQLFEQGLHGLVVFDPEENKVLFEKNGNKLFTPASNIKLLTLYAGLMILPDSVPALEYTVRNDSLIFAGTGDPSFLHPHLPASKIYDFLKNRNEKLFFYSPPAHEEIYGPGWAWDDYNYSYAAERTALPIYGNLVRFRKNSYHNSLEVIPDLFSDSVRTIKKTGPGKTEIKRALANNVFQFSESDSPGTFSREIPFKSSPQLLVNILKDTLHKDIQLLKDPAFKMENTQLLYSIPTDSLYKRMLEESDNFIAEQLLLLAGKQLSDTLKAEIAIKHVKESLPAHLAEELVWVDGSGLSRYNLTTPRAMVAILTRIQQQISRDRLFDLLAKGGKSGTLKHSYFAEEPFIFAKTGTLRHNHSLSGYLKARSGKVLIFSFMNSNYTVPPASLRKEMELILREFYARY